MNTLSRPEKAFEGRPISVEHPYGNHGVPDDPEKHQPTDTEPRASISKSSGSDKALSLVEEPAGNVVGLPQNPHSEENLPTMHSPKINRYRLLSACLLLMINGMCDSAPGALIPYMEEHYRIGYSTVSYIFLGNAAGYISVSFASQPLSAKLGRAKTILIGEFLMTIGFAILSSAAPFPTVVVSFIFLGAGMALVLAQSNIFCTTLANATVLLGYVHGSYGFGGTIAPLIATAMASRGIPWNYFYLILLGFSIFNIVFSGIVFWHSERDASVLATSEATETAAMSRRSIFKKALMHKGTLLTCLFTFMYQGAEVANSGWVVSFLIDSRNGDPAKVGNVSAGFWGGITVGRFALSPLCRKYGELRCIYYLVAGTAVFEILVWFIPNVVANAVCTAIAGFLIGPVYPCTAKVLTSLVPHYLQVASFSLMSAWGSSGGAIAPFTTGTLAGKYGPWVLYPVSLFMCACMEVLWFTLPRWGKK